MTHNPMTIDEQTAIIDVSAGSEKDTGFCSCGDEDDSSDLQSPNVSEDSLEIQVTPISPKNRRKLAEPRKIEEQNCAPLKKRKFEAIEEQSDSNKATRRTLRSPFRPWRSPKKPTRVSSKDESPSNLMIEKGAYFLPNDASSRALSFVSMNRVDNRHDRRNDCRGHPYCYNRCNCDDTYDENDDVDSKTNRNHDSDSEVDATGRITLETNVILRDSLGTTTTGPIDSQTSRNQDDSESNVNVTSGGSEKDTGFCSGGDGDISDQSLSTSEDSLEVRVVPVSLKSRRKLAEPRKIGEQNPAPLKKRRFETVEEKESASNGASSRILSPSPFRPWRSSGKKKRVYPDETVSQVSTRLSSKINQRLQEEPLSLVLRDDVATRVPSHPAINDSYERVNVSLSSPFSTSSLSSSCSSLSSSSSSTSSYFQQNHRSTSNSCSTRTATVTTTTTVTTPTTAAASSIQNGQSRQHPVAGQQRNYKNMTRERRIEANARERTRVHTISAAFETLRRAIPAYSHNQKLSKLSVLRIACSYIMTLSNIVNTPEGESPNGASLGKCVDLVSRTIQTEGKIRKRKED